jgi:hypothetical protein
MRGKSRKFQDRLEAHEIVTCSTFGPSRSDKAARLGLLYLNCVLYGVYVPDGVLGHTTAALIDLIEA